MPTRGVRGAEFAEKKKVSLYLPEWMIDEIKKAPNQSNFVRDMIVRATGWTKENRAGVKGTIE